MTAFDYRGVVETIPVPGGLGTVSGNVDMSGAFLTPTHPYILVGFFVFGIIAMVIVYSYAELVWCKEKPHAKKN